MLISLLELEELRIWLLKNFDNSEILNDIIKQFRWLNMGKTAENNLKKMEIHELDKKDQFSIPMPFPDDETLYKLFRGKSIAIFEGQIIAADSSLRGLYEKIEKLIPKDKRCRIRYIEEGIAIYGLDS